MERLPEPHRKEVPMATEIPDIHFKNTRAVNVHNPGSTSDTVGLFIKERGNGSLSAEVRRKDLLDALGAEPDETDYAEVVAENLRLGRKLAKAISDRDAARVERDAARFRVQEAPEDAEVVEENSRLGRKLSAALRERDANRAERDAARRRIQALLPDRDSWKLRAEEARKDRDDALEALRAAEDASEDQVQIDRSWALEKAGEVLGRLAAVGVDARACGVSLLPLAEWILGGEAEDRG